MWTLDLIGIGTGNPDHLTLAGVKAMQQADLILLPLKGDAKSELAEVRREICRRVLDPATPVLAEFDLPVRDSSGVYLDGVRDWHDAIAQVWQTTITQSCPDARRVALLIWGDPSLYDSALRIATRLSPTPTVQVYPGITALQALTAAHAIPLNNLGAPVQITTGRQLREHGWPSGVDTIAVMLDGDCSFTHVISQDISIWWGAYLGMPNQILLQGKLHEIADTIVARRAEARADHGWIMDTYLMRRMDNAAGQDRTGTTSQG